MILCVHLFRGFCTSVISSCIFLIVGCKIIKCLMQEYATTVKSTDVGLPWEQHFKAKKQFEGTELKRIFKFCIEVLSEIVKNDTPYPPNIVSLLNYLLSIVEDILSWGFISMLMPKRLIGVYEAVYQADQAPALRLSANWRDVMYNPQLIPLMFQVYWQVRDEDKLACHALACLVQLATLNGGIIIDNSHCQYLSNYIDNFLKLVSK